VITLGKLSLINMAKEIPSFSRLILRGSVESEIRWDICQQFASYSDIHGTQVPIAEQINTEMAVGGGQMDDKWRNKHVWQTNKHAAG